MQPVFILHEVDGSIAKEAKRLENAGEGVNELLPVLVRISEDMMRIEKIVFDSQGRRGGGQWKPLKPETIKRKGSNRILHRTGALEASLTEPGATNQILKFGPRSVEFGTSDPIAVYHDQGAYAAGVPRRPLIKLVPGDVKRWNKMISDYLIRKHKV